MAKRRAKRKTSKPRKFCDPGVCDCCQYIGEGDFLCAVATDKHMEIVVSDWTPTENYLMCQSQNKAVEGGADGKET